MKNLKRLAALFLAAIPTFSLPVTAFAAVEDTGFSDVNSNSWYAEAATYCREHQLMFGVTDTIFSPESNLTRAQLATVLYRIAGSPAVVGTDDFTDTLNGAWYADATLWVSQRKLMSGYGGNLFGPNDPVSREQMTTIFWRNAGSPIAEGKSDYSDAASIAPYAATAAAWVSANNIVRPVSGNVFSPKANATRAQVADALMRYDQIINGSAIVVGNETTTAAPKQTVTNIKFNETRERLDYATIAAYDKNNSIVWTYETPKYRSTELSRVSEIGRKDDKYYFIQDGIAVALDVQTGTIIWETRDSVGSGTGVALGENAIYLCGQYGPDFCAVSYDGKILVNIEQFDPEYYWASEIELLDGKAAVYLRGGTESYEIPKIFYVDLETYEVSTK